MAMPFIYDKTSRKAIDEKTGAKIRRAGGFRDCIDTHKYILEIDSIQITFEVVLSSISYTYPASADISRASPKRVEQKSYVEDAAYVLEQNFHQKLREELKRIGKPNPTKEEYEDYKKILADGLTVYITRGGTTLQHIPTKDFRVEFVENLQNLAAARPGLLQFFPSQSKKAKT
jgi:hypothetical protein